MILSHGVYRESTKKKYLQPVSLENFELLTAGIMHTSQALRCIHRNHSSLRFLYFYFADQSSIIIRIIVNYTSRLGIPQLPASLCTSGSTGCIDTTTINQRHDQSISNLIHKLHLGLMTIQLISALHEVSPGP